MRILIGYDGSESSQDALQDLARAGLPAKAKACILVALNPWLPPDFLSTEEPGVKAWYSAAYAQALSEAEASVTRARQLGEKAVAFLKTWFPDWTYTLDPRIGPPDHALLDKAGRWKPHLLVLGTRGHHGLKDLLLGSVSQKVLHHAAVPVRIGRPGPSSRPLRLLVALDGSRHAASALDEVARRHWPAGTEVKLVSVMDIRLAVRGIVKETRAGGRAPAAGAKTPWTWMEKVLQKSARRLDKLGLKVDTALLEGEPRAALLREAKAWKAQAIFMGSRGLSGFRGLLLGGVSSAVAAHAPCTVEIVRPPKGG
jgi:nucleotide-binding universal stress UspA family protein